MKTKQSFINLNIKKKTITTQTNLEIIPKKTQKTLNIPNPRHCKTHQLNTGNIFEPLYMNTNQRNLHANQPNHRNQLPN